jgi:hypothetical protein
MRICALAGFIVALSLAVRAGEGALNLGPETVVAAKVPGNGLQGCPSVAFNGEVYLVVWQEGATAPGSGGTDIFGARLDKQLKPLDPEGIPICKAKEHQEKPAVAACGKDFLVIWQDYRPSATSTSPSATSSGPSGSGRAGSGQASGKDPSTSSGRDWDIYGARVTGEGKVLDPDGIAIATGAGSQGWPALASDGKTGYLAAWMSYDESKWNYDVLAARLSPEGKVLDTPAITVATGDSQQIEPCAAWIGGRYAVAWVDVNRDMGQASVRLSWVGENGKASPATLITKAGRNQLPSMAGGVKMGALGWSLHWGKTYQPMELCATLIKPDGTLVPAAKQEDIQELDAMGNRVPHVVAPHGSSPRSSRGIAKLWTATAGLGGDFVVFWMEKKWGQDAQIGPDICQVFAARVLADGAGCPDRSSPAGIGAESGVSYLRPAACSGPEGECLAVYERDKALGDHKAAARIVKK